VPIDPAALDALRLLARHIGYERFVIIGATVPTVLIDHRHGVGAIRTTRDVDAVVKAQNWEEFRGIKDLLITIGFRQGQPPHRLTYKTAEVDLLPFSRALAPENRLEWPGEDRVMSTLGLEEALESAHPEQIDDLTVPMASLAASVLLKFIAFNDRPRERARDLIDIVHSFAHYAEAPDARRFEVAGVEVDNRAVTYEEAGAYILGEEVARLARPESLAVARNIVASISDEYAPAIRQILAEEHRRGDEERARELYRLFRVFSAGLAG
jgi:predicted nucleotidyltransferase